jgi:hypothetical protein
MARRFALCAAALIGGACSTTLSISGTPSDDGGTDNDDSGLGGLSETGVLDAGAADAPNVPQIVVKGLTGPTKVAVDSADVYWCTLDPDAGSRGSLARAPKGGGVPATTIASGVVQITSFRLRPEGIYLTAYYGDVRRYPRDAGASASFEVIDPANTQLDVTSDATDIYWLTRAGGSIGRLRVRALDGGAFTEHVVPDAGTLQGNLLSAGNATYFGANRQLFTYDKGNPDAGIGPVGGGIDVRPLALDDGVLYVARGTPNVVTIARWTPAGVELGDLVTVAKLDGFAMDASFIYYLTVETMYRIPKTGGSPTKLFKASGMRTFAMDESYFYWPNTTEGIIYRLRSSG